MLKYINRFVGLFVDTLRQFGRGRIWLALLGYFALSVIILYVHYNIRSPFFFAVMKGWTAIFGKAGATGFFHYPGHFALLPYYFEWAKLLLSVLVEGLFLGTAALLFFKAFTNEEAKLSKSFRSQLSLWGNLVLASLIFNGLTTLLGLYVPEWVAPLVRGYGRRTFVFQFMVMPFLYSILLALFYFTVPAIAIYRLSFLKAIGRSFRIFAHNPFTSFFLAAIIITVPVLVSVGAERPDVIITKFRPELVFWVLLIGLAVDFVAGFFWMGTAARFLASEET